jgi:putative methyltransferase (TIGR04325 family)
MPSDRINELVKGWAPPKGILLAKKILNYLRPPLWEYMPDGWRTNNSKITGWNVESIVETQDRKWNVFRELVSGTNLLGVNHESPEPSGDNLDAHNLIMAYAYVLALTAHAKSRISILDWGGGLGHYYLIARALLKDVDIDYFCKDLPLLCRRGRELLPEVTFFEQDEDCFARTYDLVFSSFSLPYSEDWKATASRLASVATSYLYITRLPVLRRANSYVAVQRPRAVGYHTEYLGWFLNRQEFLDYLSSLDMKLVREFLAADRPLIHRAPEQPVPRGFLFRRPKPQKDANRSEG